MPQDLSLVLFDDLINELSNRFDSCIFYGMRRGENNKNGDRYLYHFTGCRATDLGMCEMMKDLLNEDRKKTGSDIPKEDF